MKAFLAKVLAYIGIITLEYVINILVEELVKEFEKKEDPQDPDLLRDVIIGALKDSKHEIKEVKNLVKTGDFKLIIENLVKEVEKWKKIKK